MPQSANVIGMEPATWMLEPVYRAVTSNTTVFVTPLQRQLALRLKCPLRSGRRGRAEIDRVGERERGRRVNAGLHDPPAEGVVPSTLIARHRGHVDGASVEEDADALPLMDPPDGLAEERTHRDRLELGGGNGSFGLHCVCHEQELDRAVI